MSVQYSIHYFELYTQTCSFLHDEELKQPFMSSAFNHWLSEIFVWIFKNKKLEDIKKADNHARQKIRTKVGRVFHTTCIHKLHEYYAC